MANALAAVAQSMQNDLHHMDTISQNMVNMATPAFKRSIPVTKIFGAEMQSDTPTSISAGLTPMLSTVIDLSVGPVKQTGRPLDIAIAGEGYFELTSPEGPVYTRAGNFRLDGAGRLVSDNGFAVQGLSGDIILNGPGATIDHTGQVLQEGAVMGQIKIVQIGSAKSLTKTGNGMLRPASGTVSVPSATSELLIGHLEGSNVTPLREMIAMMQTTRHFEATQKLYQGYDDMLRTAIQKLGEF